ncbi:hypothetical protein JHK87_018462 [Glycine soja]|nr:hypothetical protein JHK87_018462 [Glycine soja]
MKKFRNLHRHPCTCSIISCQPLCQTFYGMKKQAGDYTQLPAAQRIQLKFPWTVRIFLMPMLILNPNEV